MKNRRNNKAVTEVLGTLLMLVLGALIFSFVNVILLSPSSAPTPQYVKIDSYIIDENITLIHQGGNALSLDVNVTFKIDDDTFSFSVSELLDSEYTDDGLWNIGDQAVYHAGCLINKYVEVKVIDFEKNYLILDEVLQN